MQAVIALAESVPRVNTQEAAAAQTAQRVRARFRAVTSMAGLPVVFDSKGLASLSCLSPVCRLFFLTFLQTASLLRPTCESCRHTTLPRRLRLLAQNQRDQQVARQFSLSFPLSICAG